MEELCVKELLAQELCEGIACNRVARMCVCVCVCACEKELCVKEWCVTKLCVCDNSVRGTILYVRIVCVCGRPARESA